jgi:hypothetical protein
MAMAFFEEPLCPNSPRFRYHLSHQDLTGSSFEMLTKKTNPYHLFPPQKDNHCPSVILNHLPIQKVRRGDKKDQF